MKEGPQERMVLGLPTKGKVKTMPLFARGRQTSLRREAYAHQARYEEIFSVGRPTKEEEPQLMATIFFNDDEFKGVINPQDKALVIKMHIANYTT